MDAAKNFLDATEERADLNQSFGILQHAETDQSHDPWPFASLGFYGFWIPDLYRSLYFQCPPAPFSVVQRVLRYWFSPATVFTFVAEICDKGGTAALVSTPSVYFSLPEASDASESKEMAMTTTDSLAENNSQIPSDHIRGSSQNP